MKETEFVNGCGLFAAKHACCKFVSVNSKPGCNSSIWEERKMRKMKKIKERHFSGTTDRRITQRETAHASLARRAAAEGMVLLKNEGGLLPIAQGTKIALFGAGVSRTIKGGTGSGDVNERYSVSIWQGMKDAGYRITSENWIRAYDTCYEEARSAWRDDILERTSGQDTASGFFAVYTSTPFRMPSGGPVEKTDAEIAFYVISRVAGEGADRYDRPGDYRLTAEETQQLEDVCRLYAKVVVVLNTGGVMDLSFMDAFGNIRALLQIAQPGMEGGNALADIVSGKVTPSGKLTDTWAFAYEDYPNSASFSHNNGNVSKEYYTEGIYAGYRYFDSFSVPARYGFGYGLSYTQFSIGGTQIGISEDGQALDIRTVAANTGSRYSGREVVQIYVSCPAGSLEKEYRRLAGFAKTKTLAPGEKETAAVRVPFSMLASYDPVRPGWVLEAGIYVIWAGNSLETSQPAAAMKLAEDVVLTKTVNICPLQEELTEISRGRAERIEKLNQLTERVNRLSLPVLEPDPAALQTEEIVYRKNAELVCNEAAVLTDSLSRQQLIVLASGDPAKAQGGDLGSAGVSVPGSAGETSRCALGLGLASIVLADGPAGLRLTKEYNVYEGRIVSRPFECNLEGGLFDRRTNPDPGVTRYQYCTAIPTGTALAQTWDEKLLFEVGAMIADEMEEFGITLWLAPGMNVHRNPLCGRNFEYYSEDPLLSGKMAAAITQGVQSVPGCGTTIKHLACNNQEDNRMHSDSIVSERALREIYLKGFEIAVKEAQPMAVMSSYNLINGIHAANNEDLCTKAVRCEWGFKGLIMTDWTTTEKGPDCTASGCMRAGNDLVMPGAFCDADNLQAELEGGTLAEKDLKACISRLAGVILRSNQYEPNP